MKFDAKKEVDNIVSFIQNYYTKNQLGGVVIGISGGKDSAVVAALFVKALGKENVIGVSLPCHSIPEDETDAIFLSKHYGFPLYRLDLTEANDHFKKEILLIDHYEEEELKNSEINLKPRLRMSALYYFSALFTAHYHKTFLVAGTSNKCELYVGYFTKGGDSTHDISVLADFTVSEVLILGEELKVPSNILYKTPSDGLSGVSDEEKLGVSYQNIEDYLIDNHSVSVAIQEKIEALHKSSLHKFTIPTYLRSEK